MPMTAFFLSLFSRMCWWGSQFFTNVTESWKSTRHKVQGRTNDVPNLQKVDQKPNQKFDQIFFIRKELNTNKVWPILIWNKTYHTSS